MKGISEMFEYFFYCLMLCNTGVSSFGKHKAMYSSSAKHGGTCL